VQRRGKRECTEAGAARAQVSQRLADRRAEIEGAALLRAREIADPASVADPVYAQGLSEAVSAAVAYAISVLEGASGEYPEVPSELLAQARLAARSGVSLATVLRRYFAGYLLLGDFLVSEAAGGRSLSPADLQPLLQEHAAAFDRLVSAIGEEYGRERRLRAGRLDPRNLAVVKGLLTGSAIDASSLGYELDQSHVALVVSGPDVRKLLRRLAPELDRRLLAVEADDGTVWAWMGGREPIDAGRLEHRLGEEAQPAVFGIGECARGRRGWRLSHEQARAALGVATRSQSRIIRYRGAALLAAALKDEVLAESLEDLYLSPISSHGRKAKSLCATLRAYLESGRNVSSAAAALGVHRHTVNNHLRLVEECIGEPLERCASHLELALRLAELKQPANRQSGDVVAGKGGSVDKTKGLLTSNNSADG